LNLSGRKPLLCSVVQPDKQLLHLYRIETSGKGRHQTFTLLKDAANLVIGGRGSAGKSLTGKNMMQAWRNLLQTKIIFLVAVCAASVVKVLSCGLILGERWWGFFAACGKQGRKKQESCC